MVFPPTINFKSIILHFVENTFKNSIKTKEGINILSIQEMVSNEEVWQDWLACDNEYAQNDRKALEAGDGKYLNFVAIILQESRRFKAINKQAVSLEKERSAHLN